MKRINLRDVPDDVYDALVTAATTRRQSLNAFVLEQLSETARMAGLADYLAEYPAATGSAISLEAAVAAVREVREAS